MLAKTVLLLFCSTSIFGLQCEVSFRKRIWSTAESPVYTDPPTTTATDFDTTTNELLYDSSFNTTSESDVSVCQLSSDLHAANFACALLYFRRPAANNRMEEYMLKDCAGYVQERDHSVCQLTTIATLESEGLFLFSLENEFWNELQQSDIHDETRLNACFCTHDECNRNATLIFIGELEPESNAAVFPVLNQSILYLLVVYVPFKIVL